MTRWHIIDCENNIYTSIMRLDRTNLLRVAIWDNDKEEYTTCEITTIPFTALNPALVATLIKKYKEKLK